VSIPSVNPYMSGKNRCFRKAYWERGNLARKEPPLLDVAQRRRRREQGKPLSRTPPIATSNFVFSRGPRKQR
jgi:hypothetical protein